MSDRNVDLVDRYDYQEAGHIYHLVARQNEFVVTGARESIPGSAENVYIRKCLKGNGPFTDCMAVVNAPKVDTDNLRAVHVMTDGNGFRWHFYPDEILVELRKTANANEIFEKFDVARSDGRDYLIWVPLHMNVFDAILIMRKLPDVKSASLARFTLNPF